MRRAFFAFLIIFGSLLSAWQVAGQGMLTLGAGSSAVVAATTTWNPSDKSANITLSNGNLTAASNANADGKVRTVKSASSGKKFWQGIISVGGSGNPQVGFGNSTQALGGGFLGDSNNSFGYTQNSGSVLCAGTIGSGEAFVNGDTLSIAFDIGGGLVWVRRNSGNWNNNGAADPATGANGIAVSGCGGGFAAGPYFPMFRAADNSGSGDAVVANFGASSYSPAAPSGFGNQ